MSKIIFQDAKDRLILPLSLVFKDIPWLITVLDTWDFTKQSQTDKFVETISTYLKDENCIVSPIPLTIPNKVIGVSINFYGDIFNLIIKNEKGDDNNANS